MPKIDDRDSNAEWAAKTLLKHIAETETVMNKWHTKISGGEGEDEGGPTLKSDIFEGENLIAEGLWFDQAEKIVEAHNQ